jgi:hypothetical protein
MWYIGMDVHHRSTTVCVLDVQGKPVKRQTVQGPWPEVVAWVKQLGAGQGGVWTTPTNVLLFHPRWYLLTRAYWYPFLAQFQVVD